MNTSRDMEQVLDVLRHLTRDHPLPLMLIDRENVLRWTNEAARLHFDMPSHPDTPLDDWFDGDIAVIEHSEEWQRIEITPRRGALRGQEFTFLARALTDSTLTVVMQTNVDEREGLAAMHSQLIERERAWDDLDRTFKAETYINRRLLHRVKNNLALLAAITRYRAAATEDVAVRMALRAIHQRIGVISLAHELLDQNRTTEEIDARQLLQEVAVHLQGTVCPEGVVIAVESSPVVLLVTDAMALVLLVNEVISAILSGLAGPFGETQIRLRLRADDGTLTLTVGADQRLTIDNHAPEVEALLRQLRATVRMEDDGRTWSMRLVPKPLAPGRG